MFIFGLQLFRPFFMKPSSGPGLQKEECLKLVNCNLLVVRDPVTKEVFFLHRCIL
jgi:hypothetical protein